jgi:hypothetical protein
VTPAAPDGLEPLNLTHRGTLTMASDEECMCHGRECVRLAGLTDDRNVRDELLDLARGWMAAALRERRMADERRSDARVLTFPPRSERSCSSGR